MRDRRHNFGAACSAFVSSPVDWEASHGHFELARPVRAAYVAGPPPGRAQRLAPAPYAVRPAGCFLRIAALRARRAGSLAYEAHLLYVFESYIGVFTITGGRI